VRVPPALEDAAYHVVQEGLTNVIKHAPGAQVHVVVAIDDDGLEVQIRDSGASDATALGVTGARLGVAGMRERLESFGGTLDAGPQDEGGWALRAWLPLSTRV